MMIYKKPVQDLPESEWPTYEVTKTRTPKLDDRHNLQEFIFILRNKYSEEYWIYEEDLKREYKRVF